jgi:prepilin-type processing-associated H-X9-DG protein
MAGQSSTRLAAHNVPAHAVSTNVIAVQLQTTQPDLSSPQKSVRAFVAALNANRFAEAALCVDGASPKADFKPLRDMVGEGRNKIVSDKPVISLSTLSTSTKGDKATIKVRVTVKNGTNRQIRTESVSMVRRNARWLLVPSNPRAVGSSASFLAAYAAIIRSPQIIAVPVSAARRAHCASNLKQIALAALMMNQDKEKLAITPQNFKTALLPYARMTGIFRCPSVSSGESYSFNGNLANYDVAELSRATANQLVMFYEGRNGQLDFRHQGRCNVAFADSHVKAISRSKAKTLRWKP